MKMAGIDVHKKVLMVVVVDTVPRKRNRHDDDLSRCRGVAAIPNVVTGAGGGRGGHGIDRAVLAVGVAGAGATYAFAPGAGVLQPCSAGAQA